MEAEVEVGSISMIGKTYNLTKIDNNDNYFVNGILVNIESNREN